MKGSTEGKRENKRGLHTPSVKKLQPDILAKAEENNLENNKMYNLMGTGCIFRRQALYGFDQSECLEGLLCTDGIIILWILSDVLNLSS